MLIEKSRRDKGDGSVYQRANGTWVSEYTPPNAKTKYFTGKTEASVKKKLKEFKNGVIKNGYAEIKKITVKQYMDDWLNTVKINDLKKASSFDRKEATLENQVYKHIGDFQIGTLVQNDIQKFINDLAEEEYSFSTIKKAYEAVNGCFKLAVIKGDMIKNPCLGVTLPSVLEKDDDDIRFFVDEQIEQICQESLSKYGNGKMVYRLGHAIVFLMYTGLRRGELLALKWKDVDFEKKMIYIKKSSGMVKNRGKDASAPKNILKEDKPKTKTSIRKVSLNEIAVSALQELRKINGDHEYVMSTENGTVTLPRNIDRMFRNILIRCKLEPWGVHTLRHTFASMYIRQGGDILILSKLLGHADISITYKTYIHLIDEQKEQAVSRLNDLYNPYMNPLAEDPITVDAIKL